MIRTILASAATIALMAGAASAQVYGDQTQERVVQDDGIPAAQLPRERVGVAPAAPVVGEPVLADPVVEDEGMFVRTAPVVSAAPIPQDPNVPSSIGLTPGAPLGSDYFSDQKAVAGEESRTGAAGFLLR